MWLLGFEPKSPRPQRGILTTKLQPRSLSYLIRTKSPQPQHGFLTTEFACCLHTLYITYEASLDKGIDKYGILITKS